MKSIKSLFKEAEKFYEARQLVDSLNKYDRVINESEKLLQTESVKENYADIESFLAECYNNRGLVKYKLVEFGEAINDFTTALSYKPDMTVAFYNRGLIHYRLGFFEEAVVDMKATLNLDPGFISARQCLDECLKLS